MAILAKAEGAMGPLQGGLEVAQHGIKPAERLNLRPGLALWGVDHLTAMAQAAEYLEAEEPICGEGTARG